MGYFSGEALRRLRKNKNLTQAQLAHRLCYSPMTIHSWENEKKQPSFDTVVELSKYFKVSIEVFVK